MSDTPANPDAHATVTNPRELPFENDAVLGLRRRIPTLASAGVRLAYDLDGIRLLRRRPSFLKGAMIVGVLAAGGLGIGALIAHLRPMQAGLAWSIGIGMALAMAGAAGAWAVQQWRLTWQPLLFVPAVGQDVVVPTCGQTIPRHQIRRVTRWVEHHTLRAASGKNGLGWVRLTLHVQDNTGQDHELVVATEMFVLLERCTLTEDLAVEVAGILGVPVRAVPPPAAGVR